MQRMVWRRTTSTVPSCTAGPAQSRAITTASARHSNHSQAAAGSSGSAADGVPSLPSYSSPLSPWWCLNDDVVTSFEDVSAFEERDTPYILFYKRRQAAGGPIRGRTRGRCACATPPCAPGQLERTKTYRSPVYNAETETVCEYGL